MANKTKRDAFGDNAVTLSEGMQRQIEVYRRMTGQQRLQIGFELYELARTLVRAGVGHDFPNWDEEQVKREVNRRFALQQEFLKEVVARLYRLKLTYAIVGSIASNFWGIPRLTHDVDILDVLDAEQVQQILAAFPAPFYVNEQAAQQAVSSGSMFNIIDPSSGFKVDL